MLLATFSVYFCLEVISRSLPSNIFSECVFKSFKIYLKYTFVAGKIFFTSTEVWRSIIKVHLNIWSINEENFSNILLIYFFLKYKRSILQMYFFPRSTCKVYLTYNYSGCTFNFFPSPKKEKSQEQPHEEAKGLYDWVRRRGLNFILKELDHLNEWTWLFFFVGFAWISLSSKWHVSFCFADNMATLHVSCSACLKPGYTMSTNKRDL